MRTFVFLSTFVIALLASSFTWADVFWEPNIDVRPITRSSTDIYDIISQLMRAEVAYDAADFTASFTDYLAVSLYDPKNKQALLGLGKTALEIKRYDVALTAFERTGTLELSQSEQQEQHSGVILAETALGKNANALDAINKALLVSPNDDRLWIALANTHEAAQAWEDARTAYKQAKNVSLESDAYFNYLGQHYSKQKNYIKAVENFKNANRLNPNNHTYDRNLRFAYLLNGQYVEALENLPHTQAGYFFTQAGQIALLREDYLLAKKLLQKAVEITPRYNQSAIKSLEWLDRKTLEGSR